MTIIILQLSKKGSVTRVQLDVSGQVKAQQKYMHLTDLPATPKGTSVIVTLPGEEVLLTQAKIPKASRRELIKAVPFALEEQLAADVDALYFAIGQFDASGQLAVAVIAKEKFEHYLHQFRNSGIKPDALIPDYLAIPYKQNNWFVCLEGERALVRMGEQSGFTTEIENLPRLLQLACEQGIAVPQKIQIIGCCDQVNIHAFNTLEKRVALEFISAGCQWAPAQLIAQPTMNLLQGKYRFKNKRTKSKKYWKITGLAFAIWVVVVFGAQIAQLVYLQHTTSRIEENIAVVYHRVFPNTRSVIDPQMRVKHQLDRLLASSRPGHFITLLTTVARVLQQNPKVVLQSIDYQNNTLTLQVLTNKLATMERFTHQLIHDHLEVTQKQLAPLNKSVTAEILIKRQMQ